MVFLTVMTGIDAKNESKTREMILKALDQIQNGQVTEKELKQTKAALRNELLCALDDPRGILELSLHQILSEKNGLFMNGWKIYHKLQKKMSCV